jgi:hypothetical protein|tara:strand:- start:1444 stop:2037 length:594 start_codon:yes stop_codon:yes gene_type:complete
MKKINIFSHTYEVNDWEQVRDEQLEYINNSGLSDISDIHICPHDSELKTQLDMWEHSKTNDSYYLYLHNLGITWQKTDYEDLTANYRRWTMDGVVGNWKEYVSYLDEYDVVADNYYDDRLFGDIYENCHVDYKDIVYSKHFSTNHWWTKSSYVKKLENPLDYENKFPKLLRRISWETWICSNNGQFKEVKQDFSLEP